MAALDHTDRALPGAQDHGQGAVTFALYAPGKGSVHLQGSFNGWDGRRDPLRNRGGGFFVIGKNLPPGRYEYQFVVDGGLVLCDPYARQVAVSPDHATPNAVVEVGRPLFRWRHGAWPRPRLEDLILYELHVGDFSPEGTFEGVIRRLDDLRDLGVNAIEFLPLCESSSYWGYEPSYPFAVRSGYGTPEDLYRLVDEAHGRGIAVIQDLVLAHTAREHPFMALYAYEESPWYGRGMGEGSQFGLPTLDFTKDAAQDLARHLQDYWMRDFRFDGFRYDCLAGIGGDAQGRGLPALIKAARDIHPEAFLIGECVPENPDLVNGSGLSAVWHTRACLLLSTLLLEQDREPYRWGSFEAVVRDLAPETQGYQDVAFMVNYGERLDEERLAFRLRQAGFEGDILLRKAMLGITLLMTMPGETMLCQGQEWGEDTPKTTGPNPLRREKRDQPEGRALLDHTRRLSALRRSRPSLRRADFRITSACPRRRCLVFRRRYGELDQVVVALNLSPQRQTLDIAVPSPGPWREFFSEEIRDLPPAFTIELEPYSARIFCSGVA